MLLYGFMAVTGIFDIVDTMYANVLQNNLTFAMGRKSPIWVALALFANVLKIVLRQLFVKPTVELIITSGQHCMVYIFC